MVVPESGNVGTHAELQTPVVAQVMSGCEHAVQLSVAQAAHEPPSLQLVIRQGSHDAGGVIPRAESSASGLEHDPLLDPSLELLPLPSSPSELEASLPLPSNPFPPLLFDEHARTALNEPAITVVHATALSIAAS
jgi:hypothetical protein